MYIEILSIAGLCFSEMLDLRGQMPRFTQKMNVFPYILLETP